MNTFNDYEMTYTAQEAADILGVSRQTVYKYGSEGLLDTIKIPYNSSIRIRFTKKSVDKLLQERRAADKAVAGTSLSDLAKEWNVKRHRLYNLLKSKKLPYKVDDEHFPHPTVVVSDEVKQELATLINALPKQKHARLDFSNPSWNIAIYQKFYDENMKERRLICIESGGKAKWGFNIQEGFLEYKNAINKGYRAAYSMSQSKALIGGYSKFKLLKYDPVSFSFLDFLYEHLGIKNLYIENINESELIVHVRESSFSNIKNSIHPQITDEWLNSHIVEGKVSLREGTLVFTSNSKNITVHIDMDKYEILEELAESEKRSINEIINNAINRYIEMQKK